MPKLVPIVVALAGGVSVDLSTFEQLAACKPDFDKYCAAQMRSTPILGCIISGPISEPCLKAMDDFEKKRREGTTEKKN